MQNSEQKTKRILITRDESSSSSSPYSKLVEKHNLQIDFKPFITTKPISVSEFRKFKAKIFSHTAFIFTNKTGIDYFFQLVQAANIPLKEDTKYFCSTNILNHYLQKYIVVKKRKVFKVKEGIADFFTNLKKHKKEKFLIPTSKVSRKEIIYFLKENQCDYSKIIIYEVLSNKLSQLNVESYDVLVFFSQLDVKSFVKNFPDFSPKHTQIAVFGPETAKAIKEAGLPFHIYAPTPQARSMAEALDLHFKKKQRL